MLISKVIFKFTQTSSTSLGVTYLYEDNKPKNSYMDEIGALSEISVSSLALNGGYKYEALNWNGWFMSRTMASIDAELALMDGDTVSPSVLVNLSYQRPVIFDRLRVIAHAAGYYSYQSKIPVYRRARTVGADFLPNDFNSPMMVGGGAGLEVGVYRFEWASFSIGGQYRVVYAQDCDETMGFHHGWSASVNVNLSKVAFPAFSVGLTQDVTTGDLRFALGMGMSM